MSIKITHKILCIPPYLSTSWSHIIALHVKDNVLVVTLTGGDRIDIPDLNLSQIEMIFNYHASYIESRPNRALPSPEPINLTSLESPKFPLSNEETGDSFRFSFGAPIEGLPGMMMQHDPSQKDAPDLPAELLHKISLILKVIGPTDLSLLPKEESGCNCFHCQITKALRQETETHATEEPEIAESDLHFEEWSISQIGDKLYSVMSKLDPHEKYNVYLGEPIGCTCGKVGCEHILAVLRS